MNNQPTVQAFFLRKSMKYFIQLGLLFLGVSSSFSRAASIQDIDYKQLSGERVEIRMKMDELVTPKIFKTENPASVYLDFEGVDSQLKQKKMDVGTGNTRSVTTLTVGDRTRVTVKLLKMLPYETRTEGNEFVLVLGKTSLTQTSSTFNDSNHSQKDKTSDVSISKIDFRRGEKGEGRVILELTNSNASIDLKQEGSKVVADFYNTDISPELLRKLDVLDFGTPARMIETEKRGSNVRIVVNGGDFFEYLAYQADNRFTIELKPLTKDELEKKKKSEFKYTGERLNLNFQSVEVRTVLQIIANQVHFNLVASDTVQGTVTLRLENVPWDQALSIILKSKGLAQRQNGNVLMVAPTAEIVARERLELQSEAQVEQLAPLQSQYIQINYAKAVDLAGLLKQGDKNSLLSDRGTVTVDERTNKILVQDTAANIDEVLKLVETLDVPVRQVQIETRIVTATDGFSKELGVRWGLTDQNSQSGFSGSLEGAQAIASGITPSIDNRLNVNLPIDAAAGRIGLNLARLTDGTLLDLELAALESENLGEVVASPRVTTLNQQEAYIETGQEIPFLQSTSSGAAASAFKKAVLSLLVTPQITPDDSIVLDLKVTQDTVGQTTTDGNVAINTKRLNTKVLVKNGETIVLGGIFQKRLNTDVTKVPVLGDLPGVGFLFRNKVKTETKEELLIFVTPKIIKQIAH